jgi:hypothetical protein|nr:MAG TPA: hypothetical protein [Caudoviricetes sp.]
MKQIKIDGNTYDADCNALTYVLHKRIFNRGIMQDIRIIQNYLITQTIEANKLKNQFPELNESELNDRISKFMNNYIDEFIEAITRIAYTLIYTANDKVANYDDFLRNIKKFKIDDDWIVEATELAVNCFC